MTSLATPAVELAPPSKLRHQAAIAAAIFVAFGAYSCWVIAGHGYFGFLTLAQREPWAAQLLVDLVIAAGFAIGWMRADGRKRGIATWPYVAITVAAGSFGVLAYVVRRAFPTR